MPTIHPNKFITMNEIITSVFARGPELLQLIDAQVVCTAIAVSLGLITCYYVLSLEWDTVPRLAVPLEKGVPNATVCEHRSDRSNKCRILTAILKTRTCLQRSRRTRSVMQFTLRPKRCRLGKFLATIRVPCKTWVPFQL